MTLVNFKCEYKDLEYSNTDKIEVIYCVSYICVLWLRTF